MPISRDPFAGPHALGSFRTQPNTTTASDPITLPYDTHAIRVTWRNLNTGFGLNPTNVTVQSPSGDIMFSNIDIGFGSLSNLRSSDVVVPVTPQVERSIVVMVTEPPTGDTHLVYISAIKSPSYLAVNISGSEITQPVRVAQVGNNTVLSTFGELAVGGLEARPSRPPRPSTRSTPTPSPKFLDSLGTFRASRPHALPSRTPTWSFRLRMASVERGAAILVRVPGVERTQ